jgi:hypothetical protein
MPSTTTSTYLGQPGDVENLPGVGAGGDHRAAQPGVPGRDQVGPRALEHPHPVPVDRPQQQLVLPVAQAVHGLRVRRVVRRAVGQLDAAAGQERPHAVRPRPPVDVPGIVRVGVERDEPAAEPLGALGQVRVEHLGPRPVVHSGSVREHAVQVEQARSHVVR